MLNPGDAAPDVRYATIAGGEAAIGDHKGRKLVLYFYPKDDTSGCTREAQDFTEHKPAFDALGAVLLGVSKDPPSKHQKFIEKYALSVPLATDEDSSVMEALGVWVEKSMYGKSYMGIDRSTFLFDANGILIKAWRRVRVPGHVAEVLEAVRAL